LFGGLGAVRILARKVASTQARLEVFIQGPELDCIPVLAGVCTAGPAITCLASRPGADILKTANSLPILAAGASLGRGCRMVRLVVIALVVVAARADPKPSSPRGFPSWLENGL
jgi:hypothetical protein